MALVERRPTRRSAGTSTRSVPSALAMIACAAAVAHVTAGYVYQWLLPLVSILSLVAIMVAVHPAAVGIRRILSWPPLVEIGKRSYGLYLWSWPIFVIFGATEGSVSAVRVGDDRHRRGDRGVVPLARDAGPQGRDRGLVERSDAGRHCTRRSIGRCARARLSRRVLRERRAVQSASRAAASRRSNSTSRRRCAGAGRSIAAGGCRTDSARRCRSRRSRDAAVDRAQHGRCQPRRRPWRSSATRRRNALAINLPDGIETTFPNVQDGSVDGLQRLRLGVADERPSTSRTTSPRTARAGRTSGRRRRPATMSRSS